MVYKGGLAMENETLEQRMINDLTEMYEREDGSQPCRSVSQGVGRMFCLPKTAWPPTSL